MKNNWLLMFGLLFVFSCSDQKKENENFIQENKLIPILVDIYIADAGVNIIKTQEWYKETADKTYYDRIFKNYGVTRKQFTETIDYYIKHDLKKLDKIYEEVLTEISRLEEETEKNKRGEDSIKKKNITKR